jgi:thioredoxin reductase (NADPH)
MRGYTIVMPTQTTDPLAFPVLSDIEIALLRTHGEEATFLDGKALWNPGDVDFCFYVTLSGGVAIRNGENQKNQIAYHAPGQFSGDVDVMSGRPAQIGGYADGETLVLKISAETLREIVRVEQDLGGKILAAFIRRRELLLSSTMYGIVLIGSSLDPEAIALRTFLGRNRVVHHWDRTEDEKTSDVLKAFGLAPADTPLVLLGQKRLIHPTIMELATVLGIRRETDKQQYDIVIVGAGPAGLAAAVYGASEGLKTLLLDCSGPGGQASWSSRIENYMGFPEGLSGADLAARGLAQAQKFGAHISVPAEVNKIECVGSGHQIHLQTGETIDARAVLVATGANYQKLSIPGYSEFENTGIYYAATGLETEFCRNSEIVVVGAGNSAGQAAAFLSQTAKKVRLIVRGEQLNKSMSDYLSYRIEHLHNVEICLQTEIESLQGDTKIRSAKLKGKSEDTVVCDGLFVFIGASPNTDFLRETAELDRKGFVLTGNAIHDDWELSRTPFYLETSCPGIFAAGDCRAGSVKRVASSVGEGSMAVTFVHQFLAI